MSTCRPILVQKDYDDLSAYISDRVFASTADRESLSLLRNALRVAQVVEADHLDDDVVTLRSEVILLDLATDEAEAFTLVAPREADIARRRLSVLAPLGASVLGQRVGTTVRIPSPSGWRSVTIQRLLFQPAFQNDRRNAGRIIRRSAPIATPETVQRA